MAETKYIWPTLTNLLRIHYELQNLGLKLIVVVVVVDFLMQCILLSRQLRIYKNIKQIENLAVSSYSTMLRLMAPRALTETYTTIGS